MLDRLPEDRPTLSPPPPLDVLIVEDEALVAAELGFLVEEAGGRAVGQAASADEALDLLSRLCPQLTLVDVHLRDGPSGVDVARQVALNGRGGVALFMTANVKRLPRDLAGACGLLGKPYSEHGVKQVLRYLAARLHMGTAPGPPPAGLVVGPDYARRWGLAPQTP